MIRAMLLQAFLMQQIGYSLLFLSIDDAGRHHFREEPGPADRS
jgi:hypothetical protein